MTLSKTAQVHYAECHDLFIAILNVVMLMLTVVNAECHYAECRGAIYGDSNYMLSNLY
jgi:hypothetical protein